MLLSPYLTTLLSVRCQIPWNKVWIREEDQLFFFSLDYSSQIMAMVIERNGTESIDDLVREADSLKSRLEEERAKFNDMECK